MLNRDIESAVEIAPRIWWVGHHQTGEAFQCHAYLVENGDQSVLVDPGSPLSWPETLRKIETITSFGNIRWFVCSHQDPDITGALPLVEKLVTRDDARIVTHWRVAVLLKQLGLCIPFWQIEEHEWVLDLGGRALEFILTPYLHFPGAFCTFDAISGTLFSSDLFGGDSMGPELYAQKPEDFEQIRAFHQHYMPSREILLHSLERLARYPIQRIAPQHGSIIERHLVGEYFRQMRDLECGLFLLSQTNSDVGRLMRIHGVLAEMMRSFAMDRSFRDVVRTLLDSVRPLLDVCCIDFYVDGRLEGGGTPGHATCLSAEGRYRGEVVPLDGIAGELLARAAAESGSAGSLFTVTLEGVTEGATVCGLPLPFTNGDVHAVALFRLSDAGVIDAEMRELLSKLACPLGVAIEREAIYRRMERERDQMYELSVRDPLTGLYTRRYMDDHARRLVKLHRRSPDATFGVVMFDIDHFKSVNDTYGHQTGDEVLRAVAGVLQSVCRSADIPVRYGGEELAVFMQARSVQELLKFGERVRRRVAALRFEGPADPFGVTISGGVAMHGGDSVRRLIGQADRALYRAKETGRNRVLT